MALEKYARKRNFAKTAEPPPGGRPGRGQNRFVIQKHAASRLHYDFRLGIGGVLKSWAVPKGIPFARGEKHLAVQVEDHPAAYADFEGTIPAGHYGAGTVMVWDRGTFSTANGTPAHEVESGKLHLTLEGSKLHGDWNLVRLRGGENWLLIKSGEDMKPVSKKMDDTSALSGRNMQQLSHHGAVWSSGHRARKSKSNAFATRIRKKLAARAAPLVAHHPSRGRAGHPSLSFVKPMKALLVASQPRSGDWTYEIKFDGFRALALKSGGNVRLLSRNEKDFGKKFPEIVQAVSELPADDAIFDGEIVALDANGVSSFQLLQAFELGQERPPIFYYIFDLLRLDGEELSSLPLMERKSRLKKLLVHAPAAIRYSAPLGENAGALLKRAKKLGLEGLIGKRRDSVYEAGRRSGAWIKLKLHREQEFVIGGYTDPSGARNHFGALLVGFYEEGVLKFCGKVGTGFNEKLLGELHSRFQPILRDACPFANLPELRGGLHNPRITPAEMKKCHWLRPKLVCQVKFSEWTRDAKLRQPVFLGLREDKDAREVVREIPK